MVRLASPVVVASLLFLAEVRAIDKIVRVCGMLGTKNYGNCPSNKPCCSAYGQCGIGAYCLGGCDPRGSFKKESCVPSPKCENRKMTFSDAKLPTIKDKTEYLGDASNADWVSDGDVLPYNGDVLMTMAPNTAGSVLASTIYVWYGKVTAVLKTSRSQGVVTAFIFMSDVKDEIDFEWVGKDLETVQTNYYFQGIPDYTHTGNISLDDTFANFHTYTVDWTPDYIKWYVNGQLGRTVNRKDTWNDKEKRYDYPQTPARIQLSIWPGGLASNDKGTIDWAGGPIDWTNAPDIKNSGYYYATVRSVEIQCYDPPSDAKVTGDVSYIYDDLAALENNVEVSKKPTVLKSLLGSGTDMDKELPKGSATNSGASPTSTDDVETVPGLSGAGLGADSLRGDDDSSSTDGSDGSSTDSSSSSSSTGFTQGGSNKGNDAPSGPGERALRGSLAAVAVALLGVALI